MNFLETSEDMDWLFEVHLKHRTDRAIWQCAILEGNEDSPKRVTLYAENNINARSEVAIDNYFAIGENKHEK